MAGVALGDIHLRFAWQAWHLWHRAGSGDALGRCWSPVMRNFAWQVWHLATSTFVLRGKRGAFQTSTHSLCVTGVALMALRWLWWRAWAQLVAAALCVAGVALGDIHLRFALQVWHLWHCAASGGGLGWHVLQPTACKPCLAMSYLHTMFCCICWQSCIVDCIVHTIAASSLGYLFMVWSLWPNVGRDLVHV